jgi:hypothetical protein
MFVPQFRFGYEDRKCIYDEEFKLPDNLKGGRQSPGIYCR